MPFIRWCLHQPQIYGANKITLPNDPFPSTIKKLKSVERIMSFFVMLCGKSRSADDGIFFVIDVFYTERMSINDQINSGMKLRKNTYPHLTFQLHQIGAFFGHRNVVKFTFFGGEKLEPAISRILLNTIAYFICISSSIIDSRVNYA